MTNPLKPLVDAYSKNKTLALTIVIVALVLIVYFAGTKIVAWINTIIHGAAVGGATAINQAVGNSGTQTTDQATAPIEWVGNYYVQIASNSADPFNPALYTANSAASNLDFATLQSVASAVKDNLQKGFLGIVISNGSALGVKAALQPCLTQTDVSNVCIVFKQFYSNDMAYELMRDYSTTLSSLLPDTDGNDMVVNLQSTIQWVNSLPKS